MAQRTAAPAAAGDRAEREFNAEVNAAIAATNDEVFAAAIGEEPIEDDNDTSLEEMGEGLEGEHLDPEAGEEVEASEEGDEETDEPEASEEEAEGEPGVDEADEEVERVAPGPEQAPRPEARIPPRVLRTSNERARAAEERERAATERERELKYQIDTLNARMSDMQLLLQRPAPAPAPAPQAPPPKPDQFADPEGHERWLLDEATRAAEARIEARFAREHQARQQADETRVNENLHGAATGPRSFEFHTAYNRLISQDPRNPQVRQLVRSIYQSADPAKALFEWWDATEGPAYRDEIAQQLGYEPAPAPRRGGGVPRQQQEPPRHEYRTPGTQQRAATRLPSLNSARGGGRQQIENPEMLDGSEASIAEYAFRL